MEVTSFPSHISTHAASLLASLNHQRDQGMFCDCVLRQGQNSDQLYHAHRCILAASSPVLASILSSSGALVELQDPSLSDSVLPSLLDYIYTGVLPNPLSKHEYYRLLSAACLMQMKELKDALRATWLPIQGNAVDVKSAAGRDEPCSLNETEDACRTDLKTFKDVPSSPTTYYLQKLETPITQPLFKEKAQESKINSVTFDPPCGNGEKSIKEQYENGCTRTDLVSLDDLKTFNIFKNVDKCNASEDRKVTSFTQQEPRRPKADKSELHGISGVDEHNSSDFLNIRPRVSEEELLNTSTEKKRCSSSHLSPQPCCEAVPVICHSGRAAVLQESEVSAGPPPHNPASKASVQLHSKMTNFSPSVSIDNDNTTEATTSESKDQNQDFRSTVRHTECVIVCKVNKSSNSNDMRLFKFSDKNCKTSCYDTNNTNQNAHENSTQSHTEYHGEYLVQSNDSERGLKHQMDSDFDPVPSKKQHLDSFECQRISLSTVRQLQDEGAAVSLPMEARGAGNNHCEECLEVEVKRERSYCSQSFASEDTGQNQGQTSGPLTGWYSNTYKDEKTGTDDISCKDEYNISSTQTKLTLMASQSERVNVTDSFSSSQCCKVLKSEKSPCPERKEPRCFLAAPVDNNLPGTTRNTGETHRWHLPYQGKPLEDASLQDFNQKPFEPEFSPDSDELDNEVNVGDFAFSGQRSLCQYLSVDIEDQSIINTKCNELHVSYQHDSDKDEEKPSVGMDTAEIKRPHNAQMIKGIFIARAESFDRTDGQTEKEDGNAFDMKRCRTGVWVTANTVVMEVSKPNEGETKISSCPGCSPLSEPDCDRSSKPSTVAVCIPSSLPTSVPTDGSVHLSPPNPQPFQCSLCDRSFSQRGSLNRHVRSHLGVRPFQCPCCPMTFSRQYRVTEHMRVHQRCAHGDGLQKTHESFVTNDKERPQN